MPIRPELASDEKPDDLQDKRNEVRMPNTDIKVPLSDHGEAPGVQPHSPTFKVEGGAVSRVVAAEWPLADDGTVANDQRVAYAALILVAGFADAGVTECSVDDLHTLSQGQWSRPAVAHAVHQLQDQGWIEATGDQYHLVL
jgi:hypothetical protein